MTQQSFDFQHSIPNDQFSIEIEKLPTLPRAIVYEDDYLEKRFTIQTDANLEKLSISSGGTNCILSFLKVDERVRPLIRYFILNSLIEYSPTSVLAFYHGISVIPDGQIENIAMASPMDVRARWPSMVESLSARSLDSIKRLMAFLCANNFYRWGAQHQDFASHLPMPRRDPYATVRAGDCFLEIEEEAQLVRWIDVAAKSAMTLEKVDLVAACLVVCSYQFGMRPIQLGMLRKRDCAVRISQEDGTPIVHLTFRLVKQRDALSSQLNLVRKVKREWAPLLAALYNELINAPSDTFLFGYSSRRNLSAALIEALDTALPGNGRVGYDMRHSLAQRMVDAGASEEELAHALGHTLLKTGLVYFRASANQAELVNKALGLSETYMTVAKIAERRFVSTEELEKLKGDQQIAGVPHGLPISGIGGCTTSQPACPYNPITACYGCPKFMPVRDVSLHEQVLRDFRSVVSLFIGAGAGEQSSPAYLQLCRTISEVQTVITQIEAEHA